MQSGLALTLPLPLIPCLIPRITLTPINYINLPDPSPDPYFLQFLTPTSYFFLTIILLKMGASMSGARLMLFTGGPATVGDGTNTLALILPLLLT